MKKISRFRRNYIRRLICRIIIFFILIGIYIMYPNTFEVCKGTNMIKMISPLHILWIVWMIDMILQLCKVPSYWPLGSQKFWEYRYLENIKKIDKNTLKTYIKELNKGCIAIAITWLLVIAIIATLYFSNTISYQVVILISAFFYVCDTICIVCWCPFKTFYMHNKCCTTCRIFNWDHAMMFVHLLILPGLWTYSLVVMALIVLIVWEITCALYPERFMEMTNSALQCQNCKDRLCGRPIDENN